MKRTVSEIESKAVVCKVLWFDKLSGDGMVLTPDDTNVYFHASCIVEYIGAHEPSYLEFLEWRCNFDVKDDATVQCIIYDDGLFPQVEKMYKAGFKHPEMD